MAVEDNMTNVRMFEISTQKEFLDEVFIHGALHEVPAIDKWAYILHDKDVYEAGHKQAGEPKPPHWHVFVKLKYSQKICHIASWFHVKQSYIQRIKGKYSDALKYLIHENAPEKYQYPVEEVKYSDGFDWIKEKNKGTSNRLIEIINDISTGKIRDFNITQFITNTEYVKYNLAIRKSFDYRRKMISKGVKNMQVIFITGASGVGKTTYAKSLAETQNMSFFVAGGSKDPFDGYAGQDCVILDDLRPEEHHISDLLKMTDNHTDSLVSSRYFNKSITEVRLMIITSVRSLDDFYKTALYSEIELATQLSRRVYGYVRMTKKEINYGIYNQRTGQYDFNIPFENKILEVYKQTEAEQERKAEDFRKVLISAANGIKKVATNLQDYIEPVPKKAVSQMPVPRARGERGKKKGKVLAD